MSCAIFPILIHLGSKITQNLYIKANLSFISQKLGRAIIFFIMKTFVPHRRQIKTVVLMNKPGGVLDGCLGREVRLGLRDL